MKKLKLTTLQEKKISDAMKSVAALQQQARIAQAQLNSVANYQQNILDMICEAHDIDPKTITPASNVQLKDGYLTIAETNASDRIKKAVNKNRKTRNHGKAKVKS